MTRYWLQIGLLGLGAGACSALLFASVMSGSILSIGLFYLAPLPILIVALGWSHWAGLAAALAAAFALSVVFGTFFFFATLISVGLPAWWLAYHALLARAAGPGGDLEWYPIGRLVLWAAALGALLIMIALAQLGTSLESIHDALRGGFERMLGTGPRSPAAQALPLPGGADSKPLLEVLVVTLPPAAAVLTTGTQLFNLWLAARVVKISGRLRRPWPDLAAIRFPPLTPAALAGVFACSFLPGLVGLTATLLAASLIFAYAALGCAVLHGITRPLNNRTVVLVGVYAAIAVLGWPVLLMTVLGLADAAFDLRARVAAKRGPPAPLA